ncbi:histidine kinase [Clostridium culturomicium]|uniref:histidine kinase n=1 Tax=Clostridium culturomicium TaxID=1499683 RepID=UPI0038574897
MEDMLLTVKDLSIKWQKDEKTIRKYIDEGVVKTCKGVPGVRFQPKHIAELEGVELDRFSPLERRKMQQRIDELEAIVKLQNEQLRKIAALGTESMMVLQKVI